MDSDTSLEAENPKTKNGSCPSSPASGTNDEQSDTSSSDNESEDETKAVKNNSSANESGENEDSDNNQESSDNESESTGGGTSPDNGSGGSTPVSKSANGADSQGSSTPDNLSEKSEEFSGSSPEHEDGDDGSSSSSSSSDSEESTSSEKQLSEDGFRMLDKESELIKQEYMPSEKSPVPNVDDRNDVSAEPVDITEQPKSPPPVENEKVNNEQQNSCQTGNDNETETVVEVDAKEYGTPSPCDSVKETVSRNDDDKLIGGSHASLDDVSEIQSISSSLENASKRSIRSSSPESIQSVGTPLSSISSLPKDEVNGSPASPESELLSSPTYHPDNDGYRGHWSPKSINSVDLENLSVKSVSSPEPAGNLSTKSIGSPDTVENLSPKDVRSPDHRDYAVSLSRNDYFSDDGDDDKPNRAKNDFNVSNKTSNNRDDVIRKSSITEMQNRQDDHDVHMKNETENVSERLSSHPSPDRVNSEIKNDENHSASNDNRSPKCAVSFEVSDIESSDDENTEEIKITATNECKITEESPTATEDNIGDTVSLNVVKDDQLDFEAEEGEEDECTAKAPDENVGKELAEGEIKNEDDSSEQKSKTNEDLEEGELTDDDEPKAETKEPRQICRFYNRGNCTWGTDCRFVHLGVTDKGNYSMFESTRTLDLRQSLPPPPPPSVMYPMYQSPIPLTDRLGGLAPVAGLRKDEAAPTESAWERGLRQAKEMIRKSTKRKETDVDFEDKKMNLTLGQEEIDKENDYYSRHSSPSRTPRSDNWKSDNDHKGHKPVEHYPGDYVAHADAPPMSYYPPVHHGIPRADYWNPHRLGGLPYDEYPMRQIPYGGGAGGGGPDYYGGRRYVHPGAYYGRPGGAIHPSPGPIPHHDYYDRKQQKLKPYSGSSAREVIMTKNDKSYKDTSPPVRYRGRRDGSSPIRNERGLRGDEWSDPWMRSKSPLASRTRRPKKYSSKSSYSSTSGGSSRTSSRTSYSSNARSRSHSSRSRSNSSARSATRSRKRPPIQFKLSPSSRAQLPQTKRAVKPTSPVLSMDKRVIVEKPLPPLPQSPKVKQRPYSPPAQPSDVLEVAPSLPSSHPVVQTKPSTPPLLTRPVRNVVAKTGMMPKVTVSNPPVHRSRSKSESSSDSDSDSSDSSESSSDDDEDEEDEEDDDDDSSESSGDDDDESSSGKSSASEVHYAKKRPNVEDTGRAQNLKGKSMDAMKVSGQKQQIRLTLKGTSNGGVNQPAKGASSSVGLDPRKDRQVIPRKRTASSGSSSDSGNSSHKGTKRSTRREELLKQLRAVEDAIARKRSRMA